MKMAANGCNVIITYALLLDCKQNYFTGSSLFVPFKRKDVVWEIFMDQYENGYVIILMAANIYIYSLFTIQARVYYSWLLFKIPFLPI